MDVGQWGWYTGLQVSRTVLGHTWSAFDNNAIVGRVSQMNRPRLLYVIALHRVPGGRAQGEDIWHRDDGPVGIPLFTWISSGIYDKVLPREGHEEGIDVAFVQSSKFL